MKKLILGVDLGTTNVKAMLFSEDGLCMAKGEAGSYQTISSHYNWAEQDPRLWWEDTARAIRQSLSQISMHDTFVSAVSVSSQGMAMLPLDAAGNPLCRAHIWMDRRAVEETAWMERIYGRERIRKEFGAYADPYYQITNIIWFKNHQPELYEKTRHIVKANTYLNYMLTRELALDECQAEMTLCYDIHKKCWSGELSKAIDIPLKELMPPVEPAHKILGTVTREASAHTGLKEGTPVLVGGVDSAMALLEIGLNKQGEAAEITGTSSNNFFASRMPPSPDSKLLSFTPIMRTKEVPCLLFGPTNSSGDTVRWFRKVMGEEQEKARMAEQKKNSIYDVYEDMVHAASPGCKGLFFYPYIMGERAPLWCNSIRGMYLGATALTDRADMLRAIYEGNAFALKEICQEAKKEGADTKYIKIAGGCANSREWLKIKASVLDMPVYVAGTLSGAPKGGAMLAGYTAGIYHSIQEAYDVLKCPEEMIEPIPSWSNIYEELYPLFIRMRNHLDKDYKELERIAGKLEL
ncbi:xylulokinase [Faecalicatena orotica]|uniref:Xylulokinase n=1 Tax=Faecalicatena orotica TaxID=1544 RepID=A0A2Y9BDR2_9FIRM|nr:FGGY family carbohydrate kinase [Faecalicatena orotica]PWJ31235.1 xylulokinase [Faecalicatena orotica]SSA54441.1 xylulokinase [Faecalicatena orotica]